MKNAKKFFTLLDLTESDRKQIDACINSICDNHSDDDWGQMYGKIMRYVQSALYVRLADDDFAERYAEAKANGELEDF